jgi:hypothetical protein
VSRAGYNLLNEPRWLWLWGLDGSGRKAWRAERSGQSGRSEGNRPRVNVKWRAVAKRGREELKEAQL